MGSVGLLCVEGVGLLRGVWGLESTLVFLLQLQWSVMVAGVAAMECGTQLYLRVFRRYPRGACAGESWHSAMLLR